MLHTARVARAIQSTILTDDGITTSVRCPGSVPQKAAYRFTCFAALAVGSYPMYVVEQGSHGSLVYSSHAPLRTLDSSRIERAIEAAVRRRRRRLRSVSASCPRPILQEPGLAFTCVATYRGGSTSFSVTETDARGDVSITGR
jgi:hypothetical protein